jgi:hypothetical protein
MVAAARGYSRRLARPGHFSASAQRTLILASELRVIIGGDRSVSRAVAVGRAGEVVSIGMFTSVEEVERWAAARVPPAWRGYHHWRRRTPPEVRRVGVTTGRWPAGTPAECVALHLRLTTRERITGAVFGDYPPIAAVLARDPAAIRRDDDAWHRSLRQQTGDLPGPATMPDGGADAEPG